MNFLRLKAISTFFFPTRRVWYAEHAMKPHARIRKTVKWGGAAMTVLLVVVWIGSGFMVVEWARPLGVRFNSLACVGRRSRPHSPPCKGDG